MRINILPVIINHEVLFQKDHTSDEWVLRDSPELVVFKEIPINGVTSVHNRRMEHFVFVKVMFDECINFSLYDKSDIFANVIFSMSDEAPGALRDSENYPGTAIIVGKCYPSDSDKYMLSKNPDTHVWEHDNKESAFDLLGGGYVPTMEKVIEDDEEEGGMGLVDAVKDFRKKAKEEGPPLVQLRPMAMRDHRFNDGKNYWYVERLIEHAKGLPVFDVPLSSLALNGNPWEGDEVTEIWQFLDHMDRVQNADLSYPIIFDDTGAIADGWHRICKAILQRRPTIKAVRLQDMPEPDGRAE